MKSILLYSRRLLSVLLLMIGIVGLAKGELYAGIALLLIACCVLLPIPSVNRSSGHTTGDDPGRKLLTGQVLSTVRWLTGLLFCLASVGGYFQKENEAANTLLVLGLLLVSPLASFIFHPNESLASADGDRQPVKKINAWLIIARNAGVVSILAAYGCYLEKVNTAGHLFFAAGTALMAIVFFFVLVKRKKMPIHHHTADLFVEDAELKTATVFSGHVDNAVAAPVIQHEEVRDTTTHFENIHNGNLIKLKHEFEQLSLKEPQARGYGFQTFLSNLFFAHGLEPRTSFRPPGEEIDGSFEFEGITYLLEAKWQREACGPKELLAFNSKVEGKAAWVRGVFVSYAGFSKQSLLAFANGRRTSIIGMDGDDLTLILDGRISLNLAIKKKLRRSAETNTFFIPLRELL